MFSGIVETLGEISSLDAGRLEITPAIAFKDLELGESVAVNGACLTVASVTETGFFSDVRSR